MGRMSNSKAVSPLGLEASYQTQGLGSLQSRSNSESGGVAVVANMFKKFQLERKIELFNRD